MKMKTGNDRQYMEMVVRQSIVLHGAWQRELTCYTSIALSSGSPILSSDIVHVLEVGTMMTVT